jgi:hypothetical protein
VKHIKRYQTRLILWSIILIGLGGIILLQKNLSAGSTAQAVGPGGPFTAITVQGTLNSSGQFTQTLGTYIRLRADPPLPTPTPEPTATPNPTPQPTPTCPPPPENPPVAIYEGTYTLNSGEHSENADPGEFVLIVNRDNTSIGAGSPNVVTEYNLVPFENGTANITLQINGSTGTGTIQLLNTSNVVIDTGTITITEKTDIPPFVCPGPTPQPTPTPITSPQAEVRAWTKDNATKGYVKLSFPDNSYTVTDWGQITTAGTEFSANVTTTQATTGVLPIVTTTANIYNLGQLAPGTYTLKVSLNGTLLKSQEFTVSATPPPANPIDDAREFAARQYRDFFLREPDTPGLDFWTNEITTCGSDATCVDLKRTNTSGAFFVSTEFQSTGYFIYRIYEGSLDRRPALAEFLADLPTVTAGIVVNNQIDPNVVETNKNNFLNAWVNRADFKARYDARSNEQYVDDLVALTGVTLPTDEKTNLINGLNGATETKASVLRKIADGTQIGSNGLITFTNTYSKAFYDREFNPAFVVLQYFGYLQRDPDEAGRQFWLDKLNQFNGDFLKAEMVRSFIISDEYRSRFGQP